jgi:hypothetical protein
MVRIPDGSANRCSAVEPSSKMWLSRFDQLLIFGFEGAGTPLDATDGHKRHSLDRGIVRFIGT